MFKFRLKPTSLACMALEEELAIQKYFELNQASNETGEDSAKTTELKTEVNEAAADGAGDGTQGDSSDTTTTTDSESDTPAEPSTDDTPAEDTPTDTDAKKADDGGGDMDMGDLDLGGDLNLGNDDDASDDKKDDKSKDDKDDEPKDDKPKDKDKKDDDKKDDVAKEELSDDAIRLVIKSKVTDIIGDINSVIGSVKLVQNDCIVAEKALKELLESKNKDVIQNTGGTITEVAYNVQSRKHDIADILTDYKANTDVTMWQLLDNLASTCAFNSANYAILANTNLNTITALVDTAADKPNHGLDVSGYSKHLNSDGFIAASLPFSVTIQYLDNSLFKPKLTNVPVGMTERTEVTSDTPQFICQSVNLINYLNNKLMNELVASVDYLTTVIRSINTTYETSLCIDAYTKEYSELIKPTLIFIKDYSVYVVSVINKFLEIYEMAFAASDIAE